MIEEKCVDLFSEKKGPQLSAELTKVPKDKFIYWWSQGKLDGFEIIKYYLIGWILAEIDKRHSGLIVEMEEGLSGKMFKQDIYKYFKDYDVKNSRQKKLTENYECNFKL